MIRYQLLAILNRRLLFLLLGLTVLVVLAGQFAQELALINSARIALAAQAELLRYGAVLLMLITISHQVSSDYEMQLFGRLFSMPVARYTYVVAQFAMTLLLSLVFALPIWVIVGFVDTQLALYWYLAVAFEVFLAGQIAALFSISLEKLTIAFVFTLAFYVLAKSLPLILMGLEERAMFYEEDQAFQFSRFFMETIRYVMPDYGAFARNDLLFGGDELLVVLVAQIFVVSIYSFFIQCVILFDAYRKEFSET